MNISLSTNEIHLWYVYDENINDPEILSNYFELLNKDELLQQKRFYFEKHRHQYLITRAMVRTILSLYENSITPTNWSFTFNDFGKPSINNDSLTIPLCFNVSHTNKLVTMAVTLDQEIGIDIEYLPRLENILDIAHNYFSPIELEQLYQLPLEKQRDRFFELWTLKEAYIKACGMGLSIPLDHFSFIFSKEGKIKFESNRDDQPEHWHFWQIRPNESHKVSVALKNIESTSYLISMRTLIPLSEISEVNYPLLHGHIFVSN